MKFSPLLLEMSKAERRTPRAAALLTAQKIIKGLGLRYVAPEKVTADFAWQDGIGIPTGSIRRVKADVGDVDMLVTRPMDSSDIERRFKGEVEGVVSGKRQTFFHYLPDDIGVNIWVCDDPGTFGAFMAHTTGPNDYNIMLRSIVKRFGGKANQYGVYDSDGSKLDGSTEASFYAAIRTAKHPEGLPWKEPSQRSGFNR